MPVCGPTGFFRILIILLVFLPTGVGWSQRWREMNYGPFLTSTIELAADHIVSKSITVRLDEGTGGVTQGNVFMSFDTDTLRWAGAWTGKGLMDGKNVLFDGAHNAHSSINGTLLFLNAEGPGWADPATGRFDDRRVPGTDGHAYGPLDRKWGTWRGLYRYGNRVVLSYQIGTAVVHDMPSCRTRDGHMYVLRDLNIGPRTGPLTVRLAADPQRAATVQNNSGASTGRLQVGLLREHAPRPAGAMVPAAAPFTFDGRRFLELQDIRAFDMDRRDFTVLARIRTSKGGTILARAPASGDWAPNGKSLFVRAGRLVFDVGWVGAVQSRQRVDDDKWHVVAATYDTSTANVALYIDGMPAGRRTLRSRGKTGAQIIRIGYTARNFPQPHSAFEGQIEYLHYYSRRFAGKELQNPKTLHTRDLVAAWTLQRITRQQVNDASGHGHDASLVTDGSKTMPDVAVAVVGNGTTKLVAAPGGELRLHIAPGSDTVRVRVIYARRTPDSDQGSEWPHLLAQQPPPDLSTRLTGGPAIWPQRLETRVARMAPNGGPFEVDDLTLPVDNPWKSWLRLGGFDFFSNPDRAAVCSWQGDVWVVSGLSDHRGRLQWQRIASGLFQPLGLRIIDDKILVLGRDQITCLQDLNGDGEADFYQNICNDLLVTPHFHEFAMDLQSDSDGSLFFMKAARHALPAVVPHHGTLLRVDRKDRRTEIIARGFRAPDGLLVNKDGTFFSTDQEGHWTPMNRINWVRKGGFYGNMMAWNPKQRRANDTDPPVCWIHRETDRSPTALVRIAAQHWGPLAGDLWMLSYGTGKTWRVLTQRIGDTIQGGIVQLPIPAFPTGIQRGRFHLADDQLYVCGLFGWSSDKTQSGGFYRVRYQEDQPVKVPDQLVVTREGVLLHFPVPLDPVSAADRQAYAVARWNYHRTANYGSGDYRVSDDRPGRDRVAVSSVSVSKDRQSVFLHIDSMTRCMQMRIRYQVQDAVGTVLSSFVEHTVHVLPEITPDVRTHFTNQLIAAPTENTDRLTRDQLERGLQLYLKSRQRGAIREDIRSARTVALLNTAGQIPSSQLESGPFTATWDGYLHVNLAQDVVFHLELQGEVQLQVESNRGFTARADDEHDFTSDPMHLNAGLNRIHIELESLADGLALLRLGWTRPGNVRELVNPAHWCHAPSAAARRYERIREGRRLVRTRHCRQCHAGSNAPAGTGAAPVYNPDRPNLEDAANRFRRRWLVKWILDPAKLRDQVTMPRLLPDTTAGRQEAADIASYVLAESARGAMQDTVPGSGPDFLRQSERPKLVHTGLRLYEDLGCIGCHHFELPDVAEPYARVSLRFADAKYTDGALRTFLRDPHRQYKWRRMPRFELTDQEALALASYVRDNSTALSVALMSEINSVTRGKEAFVARGCAHCHTLRPGDVEQPPQQIPIARLKAATTGCLAEATRRGGTRPGFHFSAEQVAAILAFLRSNRQSLERNVAVENAAELVRELHCTICHRRDGIPPDLPEILADEGQRGLIRRLPPPLTWTGEKLHADWTLRFLQGKLGYRTRPWLEARMPALPPYAQLLTDGLAAEHGVSTRRLSLGPTQPNLAQLGEKLVGKQQGFYCLQCHALPDRPPEAPFESRGIDFIHVRERIRPSYFNQWLRNPPQFDPTTPMPRFSPDGKTTSIKGVLEGDAARQFDAIWQFLQYELK